jgi:hypothetical protein
MVDQDMAYIYIYVEESVDEQTAALKSLISVDQAMAYTV